MWCSGQESTLTLRKWYKSCKTCSVYQKSPPIAPLHPWEWPRTPWTRLHTDYARPFMGKMFLVIIDAHSKWLEVFPVSSANSTQTTTVLRKVSPHMESQKSMFQTTDQRSQVQNLKCSPNKMESIT